MGDPLAGLAPKKDINAALFRLSDAGDPLLVRLYVDRLREKGAAVGSLSQSDLDQFQPGLEGYFNNWWFDQRKLWGSNSPIFDRSLSLLLNLFSCAFGPLMRKDLLELIQPEDQVTSWSVDESLQQIRRWIVGDGETSGFVFQHPRLSEYFYSRLSKVEQESFEHRFLLWGQRDSAIVEFQ